MAETLRHSPSGTEAIISSNDVTNVSVVDGGTVTEALNTLGQPIIGSPHTEMGTPRLAKAEGPVVGANASYTLLDIDGAGVLVQFSMSVGSSDATARQNSRVQIYIDGEASPRINVQLVDLACARNVESTAAGTDGAIQCQFASRYVSYASFAFRGSANGVGYNIYINIPFSTHVKVVIVNASATTSMILGGYLSYYLKSGLEWGRYKRLQGTSIDGVSVAPYAEQNIINITGRGVFYGLYLNMSGGDGNYNYLEGNVRLYVDGTLLEYDSTEDYFNFWWYAWAANSTRNVVTDFFGCTRKNDAAIVGFYRWHVPDPIAFDSSLRVTWSNGEIVAVPVLTNTTINGVAWYYTDS